MSHVELQKRECRRRWAWWRKDWRLSKHLKTWAEERTGQPYTSDDVDSARALMRQEAAARVSWAAQSNQGRAKQFGAAHGCPNFGLEPRVDPVRSGAGGVSKPNNTNMPQCPDCTCPEFNSFGHEPGCPMLDYLSRQREVMKSETYPQRYVDALNAEIASLRANHIDWMDDDEEIRKFLFAALVLLGVNDFASECRTPDAAQFLHDLVRAKLAGRAAAAEGVPEKAREQSGANSDNDPSSRTAP